MATPFPSLCFLPFTYSFAPSLRSRHWFQSHHSVVATSVTPRWLGDSVARKWNGCGWCFKFGVVGEVRFGLVEWLQVGRQEEREGGRTHYKKLSLLRSPPPFTTLKTPPIRGVLWSVFRVSTLSLSFTSHQLIHRPCFPPHHEVMSASMV